MAKAKRKTARTALRRNCGAMAAHMMLLEKYPAFRANQMRLEGATTKRRELTFDLKNAKLITIKTIVHVVYKTEAQNISDAQINSQITRSPGLPRHQPGPLQGAGGVEGPGDRRAHRVQAGQGDAHEDHRRVVHARRRREEGGDRRHRPDHPKTHLNIWVCALSGGLLGLRAVPRRAPRPTGSSSTTRPSARRAPRRRRSTRAARRLTRSATT